MLYRLFTEHPLLGPVALLLVALALRVLDIFVFRLDERLGEIILSKALGFLLVVAYLWLLGRSLRAIGLHGRFFWRAVFIAAAGVGFLFAVAYGLQLVLLTVAGEQPSLVLAAIDPKTGLAGGLAFALFLVFGNFVNSFMEECLFRGVMLRHFMAALPFWGANFLQAALFAAWHLVWPLKHLLAGEVGAGGAVAEAGMLLAGTAVGGVVYGYLYFKTDSLWAPWTAHTINNTVLNLLHIQTGDGGIDAGSLVMVSTMVSVGYLALLPWTKVVARRFKLPEVRPWGATVDA